MEIKILILASFFLIFLFVVILFFVFHFGEQTKKSLRSTDERLDKMNEELQFLQTMYKEDFQTIIKIFNH